MVLVSGDVSKFSIDYLGCISDVGSSRQKFYNNVMPYLEADWVGVDINGMFPEAIMPLSVTFVQADVLKGADEAHVIRTDARRMANGDQRHPPSP